MRFIRHQRTQAGYSPITCHVIYGQVSSFLSSKLPRSVTGHLWCCRVLLRCQIIRAWQSLIAFGEAFGALHKIAAGLKLNDCCQIVHLNLRKRGHVALCLRFAHCRDLDAVHLGSRLWVLQDADLILLGLLTHEPNFRILREGKRESDSEHADLEDMLVRGKSH